MLTLLAFVALISQPPLPPPPTNDPFVLFFDHASFKLDAGMENLVANIQKAFERSGAKRIKLVGHADRKGSSTFNLQLSRRRAAAVKAALVARGVPDEVISVDGRGEDFPIVETADGVSEVQNRYVVVWMN